jgi:DNA-directed RNA polymerase specialized sigma24 family protein
MSQSLRPKLVALLGAATLAASSQALAHDDRSTVQPRAIEASGDTSLRRLIEHRLASAEASSNYDEIDELTTLWMTLERRGQLDRVVERPEQFLNVALRNQKRSEHRSSARRQRHAPFDVADFEIPASSFVPDQAIDAERFISGLTEPYRSAILWTLTGRNHREVAEEMGASHAAVRKWAQRLRDSLDSVSTASVSTAID